MITVSIRGFRCYVDEKVVKIKSSELTLLSGVSGRGKSTIFSAISWCLYGSPRVVKPLSTGPVGSTQTQVEITFTLGDTEVKVKRVTPSRVSVSSPTFTIQGDDAQKYINQLFGSRLLWCSNSYSEQGVRNPLITSSGSERFDILKELTFGSDTDCPDHYIEKIDKQLSVLEGEITKHTNLYSSNYASVERKTAEVDPEEFERWKSEGSRVREGELTEMGFQLEAKRNHLLSLHKETREAEIRAEMVNQSNELNLGKLSLLPSKSSKTIRELEDELHSSKLYEEYVKGGGREWSDDDILRAEEILQRHSRVDSISSSLGVRDVRDIPAKILELKTENEKYKNYVEDMKAYQTYKAVEGPLGRLKLLEPEILRLGGLVSEIIGIDFDRSRLESLTRSCKVLSCPNCSTELTLGENGTLTPKVRQEVQPEEALRLLELLKLRDEYHLLESKRTGLLDQLSLFNITSLLQVTLPVKPKYDGPLDTQISLLESLSDIPSEEEVLKARDVLSRGRQIAPKRHDRASEEVRVELSNEREREKLSSFIVPPPPVPALKSLEIERECERALTEMKAISSKIMNERLFVILEREQNEITTYYEFVNSLIERKDTYKRLRAHLQEISITSFDEVIDKINEMMNDVVSKIFEDDMSITLSTKRNLKDGKSVKNEVNVKISYKGCEYEGLSSFSGGEQDRISLALTITLARFSSSRLVLLDECMASLDSEMKDRCVDAIKVYLPLSSVVNICHEVVEGTHDSLLEI
jgi:DNA repair exonuclease SbcCD ATPase subunit